MKNLISTTDDYLPVDWDIQSAIIDTNMINIPQSDELPVDITAINGQKITHMMTLEMAMGLLLFFQVAQHGYHMSMFGQSLTNFDSARFQPRVGIIPFIVFIFKI